MIRGAEIRLVKLERRAGIRSYRSVDSIIADLPDDELTYAIDRLRGHDEKPEREEAFRQLILDCSSLMRTP